MTNLHVFPDNPSFVDGSAEFIAANAASAIAERGRFSIALSGGGIPKPICARLATADYRDRIAWEKVHIFLGNERCVPPDDARPKLPHGARSVVRSLTKCTRVKDDRIRVTVRDFGPGVDKGNLERIFEPFFSTKGAGLSMGLAVCRTIVKAHGGRIWAENNPDRGASFFFEIPITSTE